MDSAAPVHACAEDFYKATLSHLADSGVETLVGGTQAYTFYTGIARPTKDIDFHIREADFDKMAAHMATRGYRAERTFPHWLGKILHDGYLVDFIYNSGNGIARVDDGWFSHATPAQVLGHDVLLAPAEEMIWSKASIMERERFDGADVAHLIHARAEALDWDRLVHRFGRDYRLLHMHLNFFEWAYPSDKSRIPAQVMDGLERRIREDRMHTGQRDRVCNGTLVSRAQYLPDVGKGGYEDARRVRGLMTDADLEGWTKAIAIDGPEAKERR